MTIENKRLFPEGFQGGYLYRKKCYSDTYPFLEKLEIMNFI